MGNFVRGRISFHLVIFIGVCLFLICFSAVTYGADSENELNQTEKSSGVVEETIEKVDGGTSIVNENNNDSDNSNSDHSELILQSDESKETSQGVSNETSKDGIISLDGNKYYYENGILQKKTLGSCK